MSCHKLLNGRAWSRHLEPVLVRQFRVLRCNGLLNNQEADVAKPNFFAGLDRAQAAGTKDGWNSFDPAKEAEALVQSNATDSEN